jgi:hypothetical protein
MIAELPGYLDLPRSALPARARNLVTAPVKQISACLGGYNPQSLPLKQRVFSHQNP